MDYKRAVELQEHLLADFIFVEKESFSSHGTSTHVSLKKDLREMAKGVGITRKGESGYGLKLYVDGLVTMSGLSQYLGVASDQLELENTGLIRMQADELRPGYSIGHYEVAGGTLGAFVRDKKNNEIHLLSNNHVLANQNRGNIGDAIIHPCQSAGGVHPRNTIGFLSRFEPLFFGGEDNWVDCAIARAKNQAVRGNELPGFGSVTGMGDPDHHQKVVKYGKHTNLTEGVVKELNVSIKVEYAPGNFRNKVAWFRGQVAVGSTVPGNIFSDRGDSGSLIVGFQSHNAVALLFAASAYPTGSTFACPIRRVLEKLEVDLL
jgi:hypothetical protein